MSNDSYAIGEDVHVGGQVPRQGTGMLDIGRMGSNNRTVKAFAARESFANFFMTPEGSVPWQHSVVTRGSIE